MKYTQLQLTNMARTARTAKREGDWKWLELVTTMMVRTGITMEEVEDKIERLADGESV